MTLKALLVRIVAVFCCVAATTLNPSSAALASAATKTTTLSYVNAYWEITDGCVKTTVYLSARLTDSGTTDTYFWLSREQTCEDPLSVKPGLSLDSGGWYRGGRLQVNGNFTKARLAATIPVTCYAYETGACDQKLYNPGSVSLDLSWNSVGGTIFQADPGSDGSTCTYRYGTATGSILLGGVNLLATDGGTIPPDPQDTNVVRCTKS
jgi:hypothetical protein